MFSSGSMILTAPVGTQRGFVTKAEANLPQPAEEALLVEWRRDSRVYRFDGNTSWLEVTRETSLGFLHPTSRIVTWRL
jgi:hypothetical protein